MAVRRPQHDRSNPRARSYDPNTFFVPLSATNPQDRQGFASAPYVAGCGPAFRLSDMYVPVKAGTHATAVTYQICGGCIITPLPSKTDTAKPKIQWMAVSRTNSIMVSQDFSAAVIEL
jgi:hypothetical protein